MTTFRRWVRWLTNPTPLPGQKWELDGFGPVTIKAVESNSSGCFTCTTAWNHVHLDADGIDPDTRYPLAEFRNQADLIQPPKP